MHKNNITEEDFNNILARKVSEIMDTIGQNQIPIENIVNLNGRRIFTFYGTPETISKNEIIEELIHIYERQFNDSVKIVLSQCFGPPDGGIVNVTIEDIRTIIENIVNLSDEYEGINTIFLIIDGVHNETPFGIQNMAMI